MILIESAHTFFYDLWEDSKTQQSIILNYEVEQYVLDLLKQVIYTPDIVDLNSSLSIKYLEALENNDYHQLKLCADSTLYLLGMNTSNKPELHSVYYGIGPNAYQSLKKKIYRTIAINFNKIVSVLVGINSLLTEDINQLLNIWNITENRVTKKKLIENNIFPVGNSQWKM